MPRQTSYRKLGFAKAVGSRAEVMHGAAHRTSGGLDASHLAYNSQGRIVSKRRAALAAASGNLGAYLGRSPLNPLFRRSK